MQNLEVYPLISELDCINYITFSLSEADVSDLQDLHDMGFLMDIRGGKVILAYDDGIEFKRALSKLIAGELEFISEVDADKNVELNDYLAYHEVEDIASEIVPLIEDGYEVLENLIDRILQTWTLNAEEKEALRERELLNERYEQPL